jgi:phosphoribosylanthranilate isomerase
MRDGMTTVVKICGITRVEDALAAARCGAHAVGVVFYRPSPRCVSPSQAAALVAALPPFVSVVGLFVDADAGEVRATVAEARCHLLQFHGSEPPEFCAQFELPYVKAVRVRSGVDLLQYARAYRDAKGLLLDAYVDGTHGGTGTSFDWKLIPRSIPLPVILSGGLNPQNVEQAVRAVRPWAVDVSSGVEAAPGIKDAARIAAFMSGVRDADV